MKLFGKSLFDKRVVATMYDFAQHGILRGTSNMSYGDYISIDAEDQRRRLDELATKIDGLEAKPKEKPKELTPKEVYELEVLNIPAMQIQCRAEYITENIDLLRQKISLLADPVKSKKIKIFGKRVEAWEGTPTSGAEKYAQQEMLSMIERLENRRSYEQFEPSFSQWPYTTSEAISAVLNQHQNLTASNIKTLVPDLPSDAVKQIKKYEELLEKLCGKKGVFYLIEERKKKEDVVRRRDPILLAQSPFGFFWQILGAWDKEVVFLEEL